MSKKDTEHKDHGNPMLDPHRQEREARNDRTGKIRKYLEYAERFFDTRDDDPTPSAA